MTNIHEQPKDAVEGDVWARGELGNWALVKNVQARGRSKEDILMCPASTELTWVRVVEDGTLSELTKKRVTRSTYFRVASSLLTLAAHTGISLEETDFMLEEKEGWSEQLLHNLINAKGDDVLMDQIASFAFAHGATPTFAMEVKEELSEENVDETLPVKTANELPENYQAHSESVSHLAIDSFIASMHSSLLKVSKEVDDMALLADTVCAYLRFDGPRQETPAGVRSRALNAFEALENVYDMFPATSEDSVHLSHVFNHRDWSFSVGFDDEGHGTVRLITDLNSFALIT